MGTHALSVPARRGAIEVMAANGIPLMLAAPEEYTPTPAVSHAILTYNHGRTSRLADGVDHPLPQSACTSDLVTVIDTDVIRGAGITPGVDPLGGAGVHNLTVVNEAIDPTFRFMTADWDAQIRMDPSSPQAMQGLI